ncbi:4-aminobutyrate aminotransferase-like enzyme [Acinetobacter sp. BIGb0196]|nr:4-aminobutyrate aminotransferase-like enzyme [Acinetobacter guillouiae]MCW2250173.1 4-aminobutyrate aminotransferase-like enzyme [Acinetobacter sp. BIGb0204]NII39277.1 4-aminobutyrate aminotransferase-like enzyme [Acinetobacter sp. BIGb0196]
MANIWQTGFADQIQLQINNMRLNGIKFAGFLADSIFSSDGVMPNPVGFLQKTVDVVQSNGSVFIAD